MKVIFAGTPAFAAIALEALVKSKHHIVAVFTQPDRPAGRGLKLTASPVKTLALHHQFPIYQPRSLKEESELAMMADLNADVMVVAAYGLLLPAALLTIHRYGCINIHPSLLPRWRGAAPIPRTIAGGDAITGVTIMQMDQGLDTGPILLQRQYILEADETAQTLHDKLAVLGAEALIETLDKLEEGSLQVRAQDDTMTTYAHKISKEEALLDWTRPAQVLEQEVRAFNPWPVAHTSWHGQQLRIWQAKMIVKDHGLPPRTLIQAGKAGIDVAAGTNVLRLLQLQLPGGKVLSAGDFYNAKQADLIVGEHFI